MSNDPPGFVPRDANQTWKWCNMCKCNYRLRDEASHEEKHIFRPADDSLTLDEVYKLTNMSKGQVNHALRTGRLKHSRTPQGERHRTWVNMSDLMDYAKAEMQAGNMRLMNALANPPPRKRRQNYMEMPKKVTGGSP